DMISSGESMLDVATKLKELKAGRIFVCTAFGLFCNGLEIFDEAHKNGVFEKVFTTNGIYQSPELLSRDWYESVDLSKYLAYFLDTINHDLSVSSLLDNSEKIEKLLKKKGLK
ncbi:MAG: ribose-phosphate pyrophosphokinase, partial [Eubacterium sp.]|nr:ribose-phosphate pyrophosphokinase [Eubacterium sp.]